MQSKDVIIRLIDEGKISGEEAYNLINDIIAAEILECVTNLNTSKKNTSLEDLQKLITPNTGTPNPWTPNIIYASDRVDASTYSTN